MPATLNQASLVMSSRKPCDANSCHYYSGHKGWLPWCTAASEPTWPLTSSVPNAPCPGLYRSPRQLPVVMSGFPTTHSPAKLHFAGQRTALEYEENEGFLWTARANVFQRKQHQSDYQSEHLKTGVWNTLVVTGDWRQVNNMQNKSWKRFSC